MKGHVADRLARPAGDLISLLTRAEVCGHALDQPQLLGLCVVLITAGMETSRHLISGGAQVLADHPRQRALLAAHPERIPLAVEELLRWVTPVQAFARTAREDVEIAGVVVPAGDYVVMLYESGHRDESAWGTSADTFDIARPRDVRHVAFGLGEHLCPP